MKSIRNCTQNPPIHTLKMTVASIIHQRHKSCVFYQKQQFMCSYTIIHVAFNTHYAYASAFTRSMYMCGC